MKINAIKKNLRQKNSSKDSSGEENVLFVRYSDRMTLKLLHVNTTKTTTGRRQFDWLRERRQTGAAFSWFSGHAKQSKRIVS